ncbi:hypothetical protein EOE18_02690 [Novosphingobium umbonatum]|uniref:Uncharacterized protein n=1 Tax=Novosphingobium umbonatum TaxID=1908524 RepID=A0A437NAE5_9SPHN|nr:hypothetical protein [Novosphingobium umbonatum]RVU06888.1 hypothetical protein EOE18_02690 [Novosphingobium umbonatum]
MSYAVSATTPTGSVNVHSSSAATIRQALTDARSQGAQSVSLTQDGKVIDESQIGKLTQTLLTGVSTLKTA